MHTCYLVCPLVAVDKEVAQKHPPPACVGYVLCVVLPCCTATAPLHLCLVCHRSPCMVDTSVCTVRDSMPCSALRCPAGVKGSITASGAAFAGLTASAEAHVHHKVGLRDSFIVPFVRRLPHTAKSACSLGSLNHLLGTADFNQPRGRDQPHLRLCSCCLRAQPSQPLQSFQRHQSALAVLWCHICPHRPSTSTRRARATRAMQQLRRSTPWRTPCSPWMRSPCLLLVSRRAFVSQVCCCWGCVIACLSCNCMQWQWAHAWHVLACHGLHAIVLRVVCHTLPAHGVTLVVVHAGHSAKAKHSQAHADPVLSLDEEPLFHPGKGAANKGTWELV